MNHKNHSRCLNKSSEAVYGLKDEPNPLRPGHHVRPVLLLVGAVAHQLLEV